MYKTSKQSFWVVQLTAVGRGAVATVLADGPGAIAAVEQHFVPKGRIRLAECPPDRPLFGHFGPAGEEVVVHRQGADRVLLHCHGGWAAVSMVIELLCREGGTAIAWQQWVRQQHSGLHEYQQWQAEAQIALATARTERTAAILLDQMCGALGRELAEVHELIACGQRASAAKRLARLVERYRIGSHLVQPWRVVLAGPVNVGKSSLLNALAGYARAIVHPMPGATRDTLSVATAFDGWPMELCDTAGLRETEDQIERAGVQRAWQTIADADLVVWVFDLSTCWSEQHKSIVGSMCNLGEQLRSRVANLVPQSDAKRPSMPGDGDYPAEARPVLLVYNKSDLPRHFQPPAGGTLTCAVSGAGVAELAEAIVAALVRDPPPPGAGLPITPQQKAHIEQLLGTLRCMHY